MRPSALLVAAVLVGALALPGTAQGGGGCASQDAVPTAANVGAVRAATLCLVNVERGRRDLRALAPVAALDGAADRFAARMVREGFFAHTSPDGDTMIARIKRTSYLRGALQRWSVGENIAWASGGLATPRRIVQAWMRSAGHRRNILDASFTELGVGVALGAPRSGLGRARAATFVHEFGERRR